MSECSRCAGEGILYRQDCGAHSLRYACSACLGTGIARTCERCDATITHTHTHKHGNLCAACIADDLDYDETVEGRYEFDEFDDCGLMPNGQCMKAGSEECDWECGRLHRRLTERNDHGSK